MRVLPVVALTLLVGACASDRLTLNPPAGVDFSGQWTLNEADSDDPQHILDPKKRPEQDPNDPSSQASRGRGRRGGGAGPGGPGGPGVPGGVQGPPPPGAMLLGAPMRFPGRQLEVKQVAGVVTFSSEGRNRLCQPGTGRRKGPKPDHRDRDPSPAARDNGPSVCGWEDGMLVVMGGESDDDRPQFEEQYTLSGDRQRLVETVVFKGGRSSGFTMSRVWDRVPK